MLTLITVVITNYVDIFPPNSIEICNQCIEHRQSFVLTQNLSALTSQFTHPVNMILL